MSSKKTDIHVQEPHFSNISSGKKTIEGRLAKPSYQNLEPGDVLTINDSLKMTVVATRQYPSFAAMLEHEGLDNVLPGTKDISMGVEIYRAFYPEDLEKRDGVIAIQLVHL